MYNWYLIGQNRVQFCLACRLVDDPSKSVWFQSLNIWTIIEHIFTSLGSNLPIIMMQHTCTKHLHYAASENKLKMGLLGSMLILGGSFVLWMRTLETFDKEGPDLRSLFNRVIVNSRCLYYQHLLLYVTGKHCIYKPHSQISCTPSLAT